MSTSIIIIICVLLLLANRKNNFRIEIELQTWYGNAMYFTKQYEKNVFLISKNNALKSMSMQN